VFPRSTAGARTPRELDELADRSAVRHYARELRDLRRRGLTPVLTLNHFTLPSWLHDPLAVRAAFAGVGADEPPPDVPRGGWLDDSTVREFGKFAAWSAWRFARQVDLWVTINEPMVVAVSGYVNLPGVFAAWFPPGVFSYTAAIGVVRNLARANALAYDAIHRLDRTARVGPVHNMVAFTPADPSSATDRSGAEHADYIFNRIYLNAVVRGIDDRDVDGVIDPGERRRELRGRADFIGLNYYFRSRVTGLGAPASTTVPLFDFLPNNVYAHPENPSAPPCPTTCTEFGWEIYPQGFREVLRTVGGYGRPIYVTENGLADSDDDQRSDYLVAHLRALRAAMRAGEVRARGYFAWSLVDNFEWAAGYYPRFGFFSYDPDTLKRRERPSARVFRGIARSGNLPR
jgi:beta-glucosidase/6-phospho-beta-glucosidase/beta-galactosidase